MTDITILEKKDAVEKFFKDAFGAESARLLLGNKSKSFEIEAVIKIQTKDRGTFYVGHLIRINAECE